MLLIKRWGRGRHHVVLIDMKTLLLYNLVHLKILHLDSEDTTGP